MHKNWGSLRIFLKAGQILGIFKTEDFEDLVLRVEDLKKALFCHILPQIPDA